MSTRLPLNDSTPGLELDAALTQCRAHLLSLRTREGIWTGELSASALSTATAVVALDLVRRHGTCAEPRLNQCVQAGVSWLLAHANSDGGWGDTIVSRSNISTTTLVWAALTGPGGLTAANQVVGRAEQWLTGHAGSLEPEQIAVTILKRYGTDRTFSAPILTHCALAGRFGAGAQAWRQVIPLPFELAAFPPELFGALRLPVVSYALPALIAIGYARHNHAPSANPLARAVRSFVTNRVFRVLDSIQPTNGGFLEATPLTSFVVMSLAGSGKADHPVARRGTKFLLESAQPDGSWKIDTNLSTFVSTLATHALSLGSDKVLPEEERGLVQQWLLNQQYRVRHPYTNAAPGGWAWTPLPGGVPDADDTAGALLALKALGLTNLAVIDAVQLGITWLLNLQNRDGGIPTFCRGWGKLPFDRSSADITAHAVRAWVVWHNELPQQLQQRVRSAHRRALNFLKRTQQQDGSWAPLWFGNQFEPDESNRVYGTSRVMLALAETRSGTECLFKAMEWLTSIQRPDGGWTGGSGPGPSSTEETSLALEALCTARECGYAVNPRLQPAIQRGLANLLGRVNDGSWTTPNPIGFYFAKLWYYEKLYPVIFTVAALARSRRCLAQPGLTDGTTNPAADASSP